MGLSYCTSGYTHSLSDIDGSLDDPDGRRALSEADAHRGDEDLCAAGLCRREAGRDLPRARRAERVAERDGAAVDVDLFRVEAELLDAVDVHRRKRLVAVPEPRQSSSRRG